MSCPTQGRRVYYKDAPDVHVFTRDNKTFHMMASPSQMLVSTQLCGQYAFVADDLVSYPNFKDYRAIQLFELDGNVYATMTMTDLTCMHGLDAYMCESCYFANVTLSGSSVAFGDFRQFEPALGCTQSVPKSLAPGSEYVQEVNGRIGFVPFTSSRVHEYYNAAAHQSSCFLCRPRRCCVHRFVVCSFFLISCRFS